VLSGCVRVVSRISTGGRAAVVRVVSMSGIRNRRAGVRVFYGYALSTPTPSPMCPPLASARWSTACCSRSETATADATSLPDQTPRAPVPLSTITVPRSIPPSGVVRESSGPGGGARASLVCSCAFERVPSENPRIPPMYERNPWGSCRERALPCPLRKARASGRPGRHCLPLHLHVPHDPRVLWLCCWCCCSWQSCCCHATSDQRFRCCMRRGTPHDQWEAGPQECTSRGRSLRSLQHRSVPDGVLKAR